MGDNTRTRGAIFQTEDVIVGDESSRLSTAIFLLLCVVPIFSTILFGAVDNTTWLIISIFWAAMILFWLGDTWNGGALLLNTMSLQLPLVGLLLIGLVQLLPLGGGSDVLGVQVSGALSLDPYSTRFFVIRLAVYVVFFAACLTFINNERRLKKVILMVVIFGSLMAFFGILQRLANPEGIYGLRETPQARPFGPFVNGHHFAAFMQMSAGVAMGLLFGKETGRDKKTMLVIAVVIMGVATVLTSSRGGLFGFFATAAFVGALNLILGRWRSGREQTASDAGTQRKFAIAIAGIALVVVIIGVVLLLGGDEALFRGIGVANASADLSTGRSHFWPIAISIFLEHPIIGAGFDAFGVAFTKFDTWNGSLRVEQAHNEYLQILADAGLAGFACIASFIFLLFRKGLKIVANSDGFRRSSAIGALAGCLGILVHSFFDFPLRTSSNAFFFLILSATATVSISRPDRS